MDSERCDLAEEGCYLLRCVIVTPWVPSGRNLLARLEAEFRNIVFTVRHPIEVDDDTRADIVFADHRSQECKHVVSLLRAVEKTAALWPWHKSDDSFRFMKLVSLANKWRSRGCLGYQPQHPSHKR